MFWSTICLQLKIKKKLIMLVILHLQLIVSKVQIEIPPELLQEEENEMVRLNLKY